MTIELIVASARNGVIGREGGIPWHLPDDFRFFKATTMGHALVMGRKTFASIGRPLPGRRNIVVTRNPAWTAEGVEVAHGLPEAFARARAAGEDHCFVIGGGELYALALPLADRLHWTRVEADVDGDTRFPEPGEGWRLTGETPHPADDRHAHAFRIQTWERAHP